MIQENGMAIFFLLFFGYFIAQMIHQLFEKIIGRIIDNENNPLLQPYMLKHFLVCSCN